MRLDGATILVTGANGFVGGRVTQRLIADGATVRALVRRPGEADDLDTDGVEQVEGSFTDPDDVRPALDGVDAIVHCAATAGEDLDAVRAVNTDGTRALATTAAEAGVDRFVHISTTSVYARDAAVVDEDANLVVEGSPYAVTKREAEEVVRGAELRATILRPPAILGWAETSTWGQRFPTLVRDGELPFTPHPDTTHTWVHVDDLADAVAVALTDERSIGRTYDVIGGNGTWRAYIDAVRSFVDGDDPFTGDLGEPWTGTSPGARLREELGWEPRRSFQEGMDEAARAFRA